VVARLSPGIDPRELRNAFGMYPTGVTVATCFSNEGATIGVTANSFVSLSLTPPLVSVALHVRARHLKAFLESACFTINVLRADQRDLSNLFARPSECSWDGVRYNVTDCGRIVLDDAAAAFLCRLVDNHSAGDHQLLIGEIEAFSYDADAPPIAFCRGRYGAFRPAAEGPQAEAPDLWPSAVSDIGWG